jgi:hypothetical protein
MSYFIRYDIRSTPMETEKFTIAPVFSLQIQPIDRKRLI